VWLDLIVKVMRTPREKRFGFLQEVNFTADRFFLFF